MSLSEAVIKAQQKLSEKFGIPTFGLKGEISTVPTTKLIGPINVGVGKFGGETLTSFRDKLNQSIVSIRQSGGKIGSTEFKRQRPSGRAGSQQTGATQPDSIGGFNFGDTFGEGLSGTGDFLANNPTLLIVGLGIIALMVLKR